MGRLFNLMRLNLTIKGMDKVQVEKELLGIAALLSEYKWNNIYVEGSKLFAFKQTEPTEHPSLFDTPHYKALKQ